MTLATQNVFGYTNNDHEYIEPPWLITKRDKTAVLGEYLYYFAGRTAQSAVYRTKNGTTWETVTTTPAYGIRFCFEVLSYDGKLWFMGGGDSNYAFHDVWNSTDGANWTRVTAAAAWSARMCFGACVWDGKMWVAGGVEGYVGLATLVADLWYSIDGITWTAAGGTPGWVERCRHILAPVSDGLVVIGGVTWEGTTQSALECADGWKSTNNGTTWSEITPEVNGGTYLNTDVSPWTEGVLSDFKYRDYASATYDDDGNLWMAGGKGDAEDRPRGVWHTMDGVHWVQHQESPNVGLGGTNWWDRMLPGYEGSIARFKRLLYYFQGSGPDLPDSDEYDHTMHVWRTAPPEPGEGASLSMTGQSNVCLGCVGGFWSRQNRQTPLYNTAVATGTATGGAESALEDARANFGATLGTNGYEVIVIREGWAVRRADIVARASATILMLGDWRS